MLTELRYMCGSSSVLLAVLCPIIGCSCRILSPWKRCRNIQRCLPACPIRYTQAGLFVQEESGDIYLIEDIRSQPVKTKLISGNEGTYDPFAYVCANGDHMFLMEWVNYSMYQISGVRIADGKVDGHPVALYNDNYESLNQIMIVSDQAVVFWGEEFLENHEYRYKVTVLRY